jgi:hypothetical protein
MIGRSELAKELLTFGFPVHPPGRCDSQFKDNGNETQLIAACRMKSVEVCKALVQANADVQVLRDDNASALAWAIFVEPCYRSSCARITSVRPLALPAPARIYSSSQQEQERRGRGRVVLRPVQACHREFWNEFGGSGQQAPRAITRRAERPRPPPEECQCRR